MFIYEVKEIKYFNIKELLKSYYQMSDKLIAKLKKHKRIYKNNIPVYVTAALEIGDIISVDLNFDEEADNIIATNHPINIIYEDEYMLIINKEPGYPIHQSASHYTDTVSNFVKFYFESKNIKRKIRPVNRLDMNTSGLTIFAKSDYIQDMLIKQMSQNILKKEYLAITEGIPKFSTGEINAPIGRKYGSIIEREVRFENFDFPKDYHIQEAKTLYEVLKTKNNLSLIKFTLLTGRTHQIRLHSKFIECPLLGDSLYNKESNLINRQALHSYKITFIHPITKQKMELTAPLPNDMNNLI